MKSRLVKLTPAVIALCEQFGLDCSAGYADGSKPESSFYTTRNIDKDPVELAESKMAECAFAIAFGMKRDAINWSKQPDDDTDVTLLNGLRVDVKRTQLTERHRCLFWPANKVTRYERAKFDALVLVKLTVPNAEIVGWVSKQHFKEQHLVAGQNHKLDRGDWYMDQGDLWDIETLESEGRKGFVGYDKNGNLIHYCLLCGAEASFGVGVALRLNQLGTWYCGQHRPTHSPRA